MALSPGTHLGPYEITAQIGEGGMGEVYRARDTKLGRDVAIKVLPAAFAHDDDRLARFEREAKTLAQLNHPNIAIIHGLEQAGDVHALVMELVEGEDLSQRVARGAIPVDDALRIAKQIAEALEAAHEQGIIHRDLKLANIKVRSDGTVKVLDFGLAKAMEPASALRASGGQALSQAPTITTPAMTQAGVILGTAAYMSPEQASGKPVDRRSDLWAFGVVFYEMLTGRRLFDGETVSHVLAAVLTKEPDWAALPVNTPASIRKLLRRCLEKDRKRRMESAADARLEIEDAVAAPANEVTRAGAPSRSTPGRVAWSVAAVAVLATLGLGLAVLRHLNETPASTPPELRADLVTPSAEDPESFALSPDGTQFVYQASVDGVSRLWLRHVSATTAQPLPGTEGGNKPFWSPDSRSVGYFTEGQLKRLELGTSTQQTLATVRTFGFGASWSADGVILFAATPTSPLFRVSARGGDVRPATTLNRQYRHSSPFFLPDGHRFLFSATGEPDATGIYLGSLDSVEAIHLVATPPNSTSTPIYLPSGWLLWNRAGSLVAQRLDLERQALTGEPVTVAETVLQNVSASTTGLVAYRTSEGTSERQLMWFDREGKSLGSIGSPERTDLQGPRVVADGRVAVVRAVGENRDLWVLDGTNARRFTFDSAGELYPIWSPDGRWIAFSSFRTGQWELYMKPTNGTAAEEKLLDVPEYDIPTDWSADGRFLLYMRQDPRTDWDLWVLPMNGDRRPSLLLQTESGERWGRFSPDGRWVAYISNASGIDEVYVQEVTRPTEWRVAGTSGTQWQVSMGGGTHPSWRADGLELYYIGPNGQMMAASTASAGGTLEVGTPVSLFPTRIVKLTSRQYDVSRDGRFLINTVAGDLPPITLLQNWRPPDAP